MHEKQRTAALIFGAVFLLVGIIGFFNQPVLGLFEVNSLHNWVHVLSGAVLLFGGLYHSGMHSQAFNKTFGIVYLLVGIVGFFGVLEFLNVNTADNWLHIVLGAVIAATGYMMD
jgi:hypothetical protein